MCNWPPLTGSRVAQEWKIFRLNQSLDTRERKTSQTKGCIEAASQFCTSFSRKHPPSATPHLSLLQETRQKVPILAASVLAMRQQDPDPGSCPCCPLTTVSECPLGERRLQTTLSSLAAGTSFQLLAKKRRLPSCLSGVWGCLYLAACGAGACPPPRH